MNSSNTFISFLKSFSKKEKFEVFIIILSILIIVIIISFKLSINNLEKQFYNQTSKEVITKISEQFTSSDTLLLSMIGMSKIDSYFSRNSFYLMSHKLIKNNSFIENVSLFEKVKKDEKKQFEDSMNDEFFYNYKITTNYKNNFYLPLKYIEPNTPLNSKYYGKDIFLDKQLIDSVNNAIRTNKILLIQNSNFFQFSDISFIKANYYGFDIPQTTTNRIKQFNNLFVVSINKEKLINKLLRQYPEIKLSFTEREDLTNDKNSFLSFKDKHIFQKYNTTLYISKNVNIKEINFLFILMFVVLVLLLSILVLYIIYSNQKLLFIQKQNLQQEKLLHKQSKNAAMGEMIDAIAHQWKNPLGVIKLHAQSIGIETQVDNSKKTKSYQEHSEKIEFQVNHLVETLDEFRSFFRPNSNLQEISVDELIKSTLVLIKDELIKSNININKKGNLNLKIKVIKNEFKHILLNFIHNSKDAFIENNIKDKYVSFEVEEVNDFVIIRYFDNAGGIPKEIIENIFHANVTSKGPERGSGIGLYMCNQIINKIGATITASNVKDGACFTITFPKYN